MDPTPEPEVSSFEDQPAHRSGTWILGVLLGIVSRLDILRALRPDVELQRPDAREVASTPVSAVMRHGVVSVEADDPAFAAADLMVETRFQSLPVVRRNGGRPVLVGIVSRQALVRALLAAGPV